MINPNDLREILFNISKNIILPSFGNLEKNQISYKDGKDIVTDIDISVEKEEYINYLNKDSILLINDFYNKDFELFNYEKIEIN